jgi:hypothetical protein
LAELGNSLFSNKQIIELCEGAENAARTYVLSKISKKRINTLDISVEADGRNPINVNVEVTLFLSSNLIDLDLNRLTNEAINHAFSYMDKFLENLNANSANT